MLFTNLPLCMKIAIYIFTLRSVIKPNKSDLLAASETVVISTVYLRVAECSRLKGVLPLHVKTIPDSQNQR